MGNQDFSFSLIAKTDQICYIVAMKFESLLEMVGDEPLFDTSLLLAGQVQRADIQRQLARWQRSGHVQQVRRGLYSLAPPYRHRTPHPFLVANRMVKASYASCQSALSLDFCGLGPDHLPAPAALFVGVRKPEAAHWLNIPEAAGKPPQPQ
jgi:predicted transcriptional regulator of viral defense system